MTNQDDRRRRLAAILSADVAGYSRLMEADENATITALNGCRSIFRISIVAHHGRVVDTAGDSVLAVFDSVVEAAECAIEIQKEIKKRNIALPENRRMLYRIGVHSGDVIEQDDGTVYGDGVNVAARLQALAEPGGITASEDARRNIRNRLDFPFEDIGIHKLKNIAEPFRAFRIVTESEATPAPTIRAPKATNLIAVIALLIITASIATYYIWFRATPSREMTNLQENPILALPKGPSIAVLPFDTFSDNPNIEYLADGLAEDITTALSRFPDLFVISRNSTFQYKEQQVDVRDVGRDLGVEYVLEGSVRQAQDRIRVTTQLLRSNDGAHLWAESFDRGFTASNLFEIQDEITSQVTSMIGDAWGVLAQDRMNRVRGLGTDDLDSYACVARVQSYFRTFAADEHLAVRDCLEQTVERDPNYASAWASLARIIVDEYQYFQNQLPNSLERALLAARNAVNIDPQNDQAQAALADVYYHSNQFGRFRAAADYVLKLNPNSAAALSEIGYQYAYMGNWVEGIALMKKAMKLNPRHPHWYYLVTTFDYYQQSDYSGALSELQRIHMPNFFQVPMMRAMIYGQMGRSEDASVALEELIRLRPGFTIADADAFLSRLMPDKTVREKVYDGLRKAGLPEGL